MGTSRLTSARRAALVLLALGVGMPGGLEAQQTLCYHVDAIGSVRAVTDSSGNVIERHDYLPFGEECTTGPCANNPGMGAGERRKFTGKERDPESGLDYFGARYYGSKIGRFTTTDPYLDTRAALVNPQRWNRYAYGLNNPLRYVDPDGRDVWDTMGGWANAVGSNALLGLGRTEAYNSDFASGQTMGDRFSLGLSVVEMDAAVWGGAVLSLPSGGTVVIPAAALGAHSLGQAAAATFNLSKNVGEAGGPKVGSEGGPGAGKRFSETTKDAARAENQNCVSDRRPANPGPLNRISTTRKRKREGETTQERMRRTPVVHAISGRGRRARKSS